MSTTTTTTTMELPTVTIEPTAPHTHTVVFLHGRGGTARDMARTISAHTPDSHGHPGLPSALPSFRWVFPQAPLRPLASSPGEVWHQWFDVWDVRDFASREEVQAPGLRESVAAVRALLAREAERLGGRWDGLVLAGISMGGATGVHTLFNLDVPAEGGGRLGAFLGFACRCPFAGRDLAGMRATLDIHDGVPAHAGVLERTPVLLEHCADDPLVPVQSGRALRDTLRAFGVQQVEWREYPRGGHWFNSPAGMDDVLAFLTARVLDADKGGGAAAMQDHRMDLS
ncbi:alpha/beta-hydrolase [Trametes coccinea BRFM310]|uniref:Alpha/beta-hydrolase n=1 Tax=Trametes coccinea (strain BRFM310) TaxID=1353009 RepID=A0A1Y2IGU9_TRAC3|nr:alpha/beta-hydrolase [Trametes coccinea BRFM310]